MVNDMKKEYDFSKGGQGKFFNNDAKLNLPVYLDDEILSFVQGIAKKEKSLLISANFYPIGYLGDSYGHRC
jgi:hypothetical protein